MRVSLFLLTDLPHLLLERRKGHLSLVSTSVGFLSFRTRYSGLFGERGGAVFGEAPHQKKAFESKGARVAQAEGKGIRETSEITIILRGRRGLQ